MDESGERRLLVQASYRRWLARAHYAFALDRDSVLRLDLILHDALGHQLWRTPQGPVASPARSPLRLLGRLFWSEGWTGPIVIDYGPFSGGSFRRLSALLAGKRERRLWLKATYGGIGFPPSFAFGYQLIPLDRPATERLDAIAHDALQRWPN
jgi:hypothetical protein